MGQVSDSVVVQTAAAPVEPSAQAKAVASLLTNQGYAVSTSGRNVLSVADNIDGNALSIVVLISESGDEISFTCHVGNLNDIPEDQVAAQRDFCFVLCNMNDVIAPFATSFITSEDDATIANGNVNVVLISRSNLNHSNVGETEQMLRYQMGALRKAVVYYNQQNAAIAN